MQSFTSTLEKHGLTLKRSSVQILQVNIGRRCNQACHHCHVESSPLRTENMDEKTVDRVIELLAASKTIETVDITGGAPELNPYFRKLVIAARNLNKKVIDRCNLTILFEKDQQDTAQFLKENHVHIVASLPCYSKENVERQRGAGVFNKSIEALRILNNLGYGKLDSNLNLDLVYNPTGPSLPPSQQKLEIDYKKELRELFGIEFNHLFTITNMPIKRFLVDLEKSKRLEQYMDLLANSFNSKALTGVMCKNLISVSWNGELFDCDFNQMLELPLGSGRTGIWDIHSFDNFENNRITVADHCYACTAGAGSSCGGALV
ncbi:MAG: radical SAM protein [Bdellovibrionales bacterium CG10_big_fil_rev_8_21_14_0_10_45_34]|nr:MAG: radical SAM protein [Bdellovibrionales bacterium CG10_big_fil_rev_8_21_14_0_10_45_34]